MAKGINTGAHRHPVDPERVAKGASVACRVQWKL